MPIGYVCKEHGYQRECDNDGSGQRICPECGKAVTAITGKTRSTQSSPPEDDPTAAEGDIDWIVSSRGGPFSVRAFDHEEAAEKAVRKVKDPQSIREIRPRVEKYGRH